MLRLTLSVLLLMLVSKANAISNISINVADLSAGVTTDYEFIFTTDRDMFSGDVVVLQTNSSLGPNFSNSILAQMLPNIGTITNRTNTSSNITLNDTISSGSEFIITLSNIINPGNPGQGPDYTIRTVVFDPTPIIVEVGDIPGSTYTPSSLPAVSVPIPDQVIFEGDDLEVVIADLNDHFTDGDMDDLTFSSLDSHDQTLLTVEVNADQLSLDGHGSGSTAVTIEASDLPSGTGEGLVEDEFNVRVIGELNNAYVSPSSTQGGATTDYTIGFEAVNNISTDHFIVVSTEAVGSDFSQAVLNSITGGSLTASIFSQTSEVMVVEINQGLATEFDGIELQFNQITNPSINGLGPDYTISIFDFSNSYEQDKVTVPGITFDSLIGSPVVTNPIDSANLNEVDGSVIWVADLNNHFEDTDGDPLTYTVQPSHDTNILSATVVGSELTLIPLMYGNTSVSIMASDLPSGTGEGEVDQAFSVAVFGELKTVSVTPSDFEVNAANSYQIIFDADIAFDQGDVLGFQTTVGGPDLSNATIGSVTSANIELSVFATSVNQIALNTANSQVNPGDTISFTLDNVTNPSDYGVGAPYEIVHVKFPEGVIASGMTGGNQFTNSDVIFADGFDGQSQYLPILTQGKVTLLNQRFELLTPVDD